ncbi:L-threonylcarbamoyladenylate synthase [Reichenbachiella versicolor]|uniref:L-threonylcarbamoyladenylate synthase n=1 Tax=Reichenbachiella versicolor TaxID=1821036 RepID=UPI000D6E494F|nr:L-threonylcarbamoyladenylate synthase [Reichenbachiella versicolor]
MSIISSDIDMAVSILNRNELVGIPTETVYGLAGNIFSESAIHKIFETKQRPLFNPLIVHVHSLDQLLGLTEELPDKAKQLADHFWPGSLTLILKKKAIIPDLISAGKDTVAVRMPNHPVTIQLLKRLDFPLAAPSANPFGCISPTSASHVDGYFKDSIEMVLEGGDCQNGIESTIIGFEQGEPILYRLGAISREEIENVVGSIQLKNKDDKAPEAPGMLSRHYAPRTKTYLVRDVSKALEEFSDKKVGVILFKRVSNINADKVIILSPNGNLKEAASKLYNTMHYLDTLELDAIVAEEFPNEGLGLSINDRLRRATKDA